MGCHIWFERPITDKEFALMKEYAVIAAESYLPKDGEDFECDFNETHVEAIKRSVETGEPQPELYNCTWWQLGYGETNPALGEDFTVFNKNGTLYVDVGEFHNTARESIGIYTYPRKIIHNKRELRRYLGKKYFNITPREHERLSEFWKKYPNGIMSWG